MVREEDDETPLMGIGETHAVPSKAQRRLEAVVLRAVTKTFWRSPTHGDIT